MNSYAIIITNKDNVMFFFVMVENCDKMARYLFSNFEGAMTIPELQFSQF
jgi:hypothetical protein